MSPVPAGDALGPPDTHTGAQGASESEPAPVWTSSTGRFWPSSPQSASAVTEYGDPFTVRHWCHAEPLPHTVADAIFGLGIDPDMTLTGLRARLALTDDDLALLDYVRSTAFVACTPAERALIDAAPELLRIGWDVVNRRNGRTEYALAGYIDELRVVLMRLDVAADRVLADREARS